MKRKNADKLLLRVMKIMVREMDESKRHDLYKIGESLVTEYKDLSKDEKQKEICSMYGVDFCK